MSEQWWRPKDAFDLARETMQSACSHTVVLKREARWEPNFIEEFPCYQCRDCRKALNWWPTLMERGNDVTIVNVEDFPR